MRAPADGYVTNVALRKGARVANLPLACDGLHRYRRYLIGAEISGQCRYVRSGQPAEVTFKFMPVQVYGSKVERAAGWRR